MLEAYEISEYGRPPIEEDFELLMVKGSTVTFGGAICWGLFSLGYQGLIDDVALYTTALTDEEIAAASE